MLNQESRIKNQESRQAFTLTELLVTISIIAFLLMAGVAVYWRINRGYALRAAISHIESSLRGARAFAVHERSPTIVVLVPSPTGAFEPDERIERIYALGKRTVSYWHFEEGQLSPDGSALSGALGQEGTVGGTARLVPGRVGRALLLDGESDHVSVSSPYLNEVRDGVFVEAYVYPDASGLGAGEARLPIVSKRADGKATFALALTYEPTSGLFRLEGSVQNGSGSVSAYTAALMRPGEWAHVAMEYAGDDRDPGVVLRVNGRQVTLYEPKNGTGPLETNAEAMLIGKDGSDRFQGRIDELKVAALVATEVRKLPQNTEVLVDTGTEDGRIYFDEEGKLDPRHHTRVVRFRVASPRDKLRRNVLANWHGGIEIGEQEREAE